MKRSKMILMMVAAFMLAAFSVAQADNIILVTSPVAGYSTVDRSQLQAPPNYTPVLSHFFSAAGSNGDGVLGGVAGGLFQQEQSDGRVLGDGRKLEW